MKKYCLLQRRSSCAFSCTCAYPTVADINGGANTSGAYDQPTAGGGVNDAYNAQTEFENARKVNECPCGASKKISMLKRLKIRQ